MPFDDLRRPPLDQARLTASLCRAGSLWREVEVLAATPSTNAVVADRARSGAGEGLVVLAEHQRAGRGRLDRSWVTPARAAVTVSLLLGPAAVPSRRWPWLPILGGIAVSEAVRRVSGVVAELKWPNDVMAGERKLAGILAERVEVGSGPMVVIGIGLNVSTTRAELPVPGATSLELEGATMLDRSVLVREVLRLFERLYLQWRTERGDAAGGLHESYVRRCATIGRQVTVDLPAGRQVRGEAVGIDADGRLLVRTASGVEELGAGDVVHVRPDAGSPRGPGES